MTTRLMCLVLVATAGCVARPPYGRLRAFEGRTRHFSTLAMAATGYDAAAEGTSVIGLSTGELMLAGWLATGEGVAGEFELAPHVPVGFVARLDQGGEALWRVQLRTCERPVRMAVGDAESIYFSAFGVLGVAEDARRVPTDAGKRCTGQGASVVKLSGTGAVEWKVDVDAAEALQLAATNRQVFAAGPVGDLTQSIFVALGEDGVEQWRHQLPGLITAVSLLPGGKVAVASNGVVPDRRCLISAYDAATGQPAWAQELPPTLGRCRAGQLGATETGLVFQSVDTEPNGAETITVSGFDAANGKLRWLQPLTPSDDKLPLPTAVLLTGTVKGDHGREPLLMAIDPVSGHTSLLAGPRAITITLSNGHFLESVVEVQSISRGVESVYATGSVVGRLSYAGRLIEAVWELHPEGLELTRALYVVRIPLP